jgi:hypothetical protein
MDTDTAKTLRALLARSRPSVNVEGYPLEVRARAGAWIRTRRDAGARWTELGRELGITRTTARAWATREVETSAREAEVRSPSFLPVRVGDGEPSESTSGSPVLITPRGYRVQGLGLEQLAALLERVG